MSVVASAAAAEPLTARRRLSILATALGITCLMLAALAPRALAIDPAVSIPDASLEAKVRAALSYPVGTITESKMLELTSLDAANATISNLTGLEHATNLHSLALGNNSITSAAPLSGLTSLTSLDLTQNALTDITPLAGLTNLTSLYVGNNPITSIAAVSGMASMYDLSLAWCEVTDISPLSGLAALRHLSIYHNPGLANLTPLSGLTQLRSLSAGQIAATDLAPLAGLTELTSLDLGYVPVTDISPLAGMTKLNTLNLYSTTTLTDISAIGNMPDLQWLNLSYGEIYDITPLASLNAGGTIYLPSNWLDLTPGSETSQTIDALATKGYVFPSVATQRTGGAIIGAITSPNGTPLSGVTVTLTQGPRATSSAGGAYAIGLAKPGERTITFSRPYYVSKSTTLTVAENVTSTVNVTLTPACIALNITRSPSASSLTYKRKRGAAKFTLSATLSDARGKVRGQRVWLQKSTNGRNWTTLTKVTTNSLGKASVALKLKKKQTIYYRWYAPQTAYNFSKTTTKQRVRIK